MEVRCLDREEKASECEEDTTKTEAQASRTNEKNPVNLVYTVHTHGNLDMQPGGG